MASAMVHLTPRHIQNMSEAASIQSHWGYANRAVPCTNDAGSCAYLDVVYHSHDLVLFIWAIYSWSSPKQSESLQPVLEGEGLRTHMTTFERLRSSLATYRRQYLLPEFTRPIFGRTTKTQVLVLATLTGYLAVFSFVGIVYNTWVTPVKKMPGVYNTRTSLGPWADRVGVLAYALTPLSILLSSRESLLSLITGLPYQSFNFLHRWLGYIIVAQSIMHTIGWSIIEIRLYQPQPTVAVEWIKQLYMIWGVIAMFLLLVLFILSTPWAIKRTGYEFFRKSHYVLAMVYIGACWGHWSKLSCFLIPALVVWFIDRGVRLVRTGLLHYNYIDGGSKMGFRSADARITSYPDDVNGDVVRLDFSHPQEPWKIGQHFYLTFPKLSIWQSHPFTPLNVPLPKPSGVPHAYVFRAKSGETARVARLAGTHGTATNEKGVSHLPQTTSVVLSGPYGVSEVDNLSFTTNILCIAGGTGITYVLPVLLSQITNCACSSVRKLQLVWAIRRKADIAWIQPELNLLYEASRSMDLKISIFITREHSKIVDSSTSSESDLHKAADFKVSEKAVSSGSSTSSSSDQTNVAGCCAKKNTVTDKEIELCNPPVQRKQSITIERRGSLHTAPPEMRHPDLQAIVKDFVAGTVQGSTAVYASGPGGMISDLRTIVAGVNDGSKVWRGEERSIVELKCDDRLEW
ncbi:hypothetical protein LTR64_001726 [Lithohypha guttulata]|uniref:FAD-binding FR-type domain-containing protein n=1 Tax=Lithohypha guttulata TaxID=1690604 RepID=A0AAN7SVB8_9EURO|nr:hypothetical protein LTR51_003920 [Lithohypha guttulata]KAK5082426.1 hypothetical protein LTR05_007573 [Lithohypha guttulata]